MGGIEGRVGNALFLNRWNYHDYHTTAAAADAFLCHLFSSSFSLLMSNLILCTPTIFMPLDLWYAAPGYFYVLSTSFSTLVCVFIFNVVKHTMEEEKIPLLRFNKSHVIIFLLLIRQLRVLIYIQINIILTIREMHNGKIENYYGRRAEGGKV